MPKEFSGSLIPKALAGELVPDPAETSRFFRPTGGNATTERADFLASPADV